MLKLTVRPVTFDLSNYNTDVQIHYNHLYVPDEIIAASDI